MIRDLFTKITFFLTVSLMNLAAIVDLSPTHVSVIERGLKVAKLDTFVAIANLLHRYLHQN